MLKETETEETIGFLLHFHHWKHFNWLVEGGGPAPGYAYIAKKLSKVCEMIYKLRFHVTLLTLRINNYSMFHLHFQYSLFNWGRALKVIITNFQFCRAKF